VFSNFIVVGLSAAMTPAQESDFANGNGAEDDSDRESSS
jgi:hypothetical protein